MIPIRLRVSSITRIKSFQGLQNYPLENYFHTRNKSIGALAQLVERVVRNDEAKGSTPLSSIFIPSTTAVFISAISGVPGILCLHHLYISHGN